jgi:hypothetical protein
LFDFILENIIINKSNLFSPPLQLFNPQPHNCDRIEYFLDGRELQETAEHGIIWRQNVSYVTLAIKNSEGLYLVVLQNMILGEDLQGTITPNRIWRQNVLYATLAIKNSEGLYLVVLPFAGVYGSGNRCRIISPKTTCCKPSLQR